MVRVIVILLCSLLTLQGFAQYRRSPTRRDDPRTPSREDASERKSYRFKTAVERLPKDIPDWFVELDANADGQVMMFEFTQDWNKDRVAEFAKFDLNGDGVVTPKECQSARIEGAVFTGSKAASLASSSDSSSSARNDDVPHADSPDGAKVVSNAATANATASTRTYAEPKPAAESAENPENVEVPEAYFKYAIGYIRKYDTDGDGLLSKDECQQMPKDPSEADHDRDGFVSPREYAVSIMKR